MITFDEIKDRKVPFLIKPDGKKYKKNKPSKVIGYSRSDPLGVGDGLA